MYVCEVQSQAKVYEILILLNGFHFMKEKQRFLAKNSQIFKTLNSMRHELTLSN